MNNLNESISFISNVKFENATQNPGCFINRNFDPENNNKNKETNKTIRIAFDRYFKSLESQISEIHLFSKKQNFKQYHSFFTLGELFFIYIEKK